MTFGIHVFKNQKERGYLTFASGKRVVLLSDELLEFKQKIRDLQYSATERHKAKESLYRTIYKVIRCSNGHY